MKRLRKIIALCTMGVLMGILLLGLVRTVVLPEAINDYENRPAAVVAVPTLSGFLDGSFQDSLEPALADQISFATTMKKYYNDRSSEIMEDLLNKVLAQKPQRYLTLKGMRIFGGTNLVYPTKRFDEIADALALHADNLNRVLDGVDAYLYYIEKDTDINFETGEKTGAFEYLQEKLTLSHSAKFSVDSFAQFRDAFFVTDHHWNADGSYQGYLEVRGLLGITEPAVPKGEKFVADAYFAGSKAVGSETARFIEEFDAYHFEFPAMTVWKNGVKCEDYGMQNQSGDLRYSDYYGEDVGELILSGPGEGKLLVIGESYDNAILKLLATHYETLYSIDLRYYEGTFRLKEYMQANGISRVLLIGNMDFFLLDDFLLED